jgi:hypothetical protein
MRVRSFHIVGKMKKLRRRRRDVVVAKPSAGSFSMVLAR